MANKACTPGSDEPIVLRRAHHTGLEDVSERVQVVLSSSHDERGGDGKRRVTQDEKSKTIEASAMAGCRPVMHAVNDDYWKADSVQMIPLCQPP